MKLSIIIPVYNAENTIEKLVKSITDCTRDGYEILLVDDGSTDKSREVCQDLAAKDKRITVLCKENGGVSSARNYGLGFAKGEYIYFCDSDDFVFADVLSEAIDCLDSGVDLFLFDYIYKFLESGETSKSSFKLISGTVLKREYIISNILSPLVLKSGTDMAPLWHKIFKRELIKKNHIMFEENVHKGEDWEFVLDYLSVCETTFYIPKILYEYRIDGSQCESKYKKSTGIQLLGAYQRKIELNKKYKLNANKAQVMRWYADLINKIIYSAKAGCKIEELHQMACDKTVQEGAKLILHTKNQALMQNEISRRYKLYAFLIRRRMPRLLRLATRVLSS